MYGDWFVVVLKSDVRSITIGEALREVSKVQVDATSLEASVAFLFL